jgi:hypothetical protein
MVANPQPTNSPITPYGNASPITPNWVNFLPTQMGADGRMPMATGLSQDHINAIDTAAPPTYQSFGQDPNQANELQAMKDQLAKLMAGQNQNQYVQPRLGGGSGSDPGGYSTSGRGGGGGWGGPGHSNTGSGGLW